MLLGICFFERIFVGQVYSALSLCLNFKHDSITHGDFRHGLSVTFKHPCTLLHSQLSENIKIK